MCPREVACARPGRAVRLAPIHGVAGLTRSNAKPTTSGPTVPSPTGAYPRPRHDAPREPPARRAVSAQQPSAWLPEAAPARVAVTDASGGHQVIGHPSANSPELGRPGVRNRPRSTSECRSSTCSRRHRAEQAAAGSGSRTIGATHKSAPRQMACTMGAPQWKLAFAVDERRAHS